MKIKILKFLVMVIALLGIFLISYYDVPKYYNLVPKDYNWQGSNLIGHAFGSVDGTTYTNSLEAFERAYDKGVRNFEVDMQLTADDKIVLVHEWSFFYNYAKSNKVPTEEEFLSTPIYGKYTPLSFENLLELMKKYPDIWIITDTKDTKEETIKKQFEEMVRVAEETHLNHFLDRFVIQVYNEEMHETIKEIYPFKNVLFTLYKYWKNDDMKKFDEICKWSVDNNIKGIVIWNYKFTEEVYEIIKKYELDIYVHTENNLREAENFLIQGVKGVYTDTISVDALEM